MHVIRSHETFACVPCGSLYGVSWDPLIVRSRGWAVCAELYQRLEANTPSFAKLRHLCEHIGRAPYRDLVHGATSMHTLLVSQHREMEWDCDMLRIELLANGSFSFALTEKPFVAPTPFTCKSEQLVSTFEGFLRTKKWVTALAVTTRPTADPTAMLAALAAGDRAAALGAALCSWTWVGATTSSGRRNATSWGSSEAVSGVRAVSWNEPARQESRWSSRMTGA